VIFLHKIVPRYTLYTIYYILFCGCITTEYNVATHKQDIFLYSTEKEVTLGENVAKKIASEFKISANPYYIQRIKRIGEKIAGVCSRKEISYYFYVIDDEKKNAFSIPGGYVYIYKGLLDLLGNDDELAFVLAHEISHIACRHGIKRLQAALGYNFLILASMKAPSGPQFSQGLALALAQIMSGYSREDELTADELAVKYCKQAAFNPKAGIEALEKLYQEDKKTLNPLVYFRTHPYTAQRIRHIKQTLHLPLCVDDYIN